MNPRHPIGIFDSGYGGLTVFRSIYALMPEYDYLYLGDNARAPYGNRSFETIHQYTRQSVAWLFDQGCPLVILACNTASARALRMIQQKDLPQINPNNRVLGVIRPTTEIIGKYSHTRHVGILGTKGTVSSKTYPIEIQKFFPNLTVHQLACPIWVPLVEHFEYDNAGTDFFVQKYINLLLEQAPDIDVILLACTHYPLLIQSIRKYLPNHITLLSQGEIVAQALQDYLTRHPAMQSRLSTNGNVQFFSTDDAEDFNLHASHFFGSTVQATYLPLEQLTKMS